MKKYMLHVLLSTCTDPDYATVYAKSEQEAVNIVEADNAAVLEVIELNTKLRLL